MLIRLSSISGSTLLVRRSFVHAITKKGNVNTSAVRLRVIDSERFTRSAL